MPPNRDKSLDEADPLDELLRQAEWPDLAPLQLARLESRWNRVRPRPPRRRLMPAAAVAAAILVAAAIWHRADRRPDAPLAISVARQEPAIPPVRQIEPAADNPNETISREPTTLELVLFQAAEHRARLALQLRERDPLERTLAKLVEAPDTSIEELIAAEDSGKLTSRLFEELPRSRGQRRILLARLLVAIETADSLPALLVLWSDLSTREIVEPTLVRLADGPTLASLIREPQSFDQRVELLVRIGKRADREAQGLVLEAAIDARTLPAALAAARRSIPPAEFLFSALSHEQADVRTAAALLLGAHEDTAVTGRLIALARQHPRRSETWIALLQRDDPAARMIVEAARRNPQVMASVTIADVTRTEALYPIKVGSPVL